MYRGRSHTYGCGSFSKSLLNLLEYLLLFYTSVVLVIKACGILVPWAGVRHAPSALEAKSQPPGPPGKSWKNSSSEMQNKLWSCTSPWLKHKQKKSVWWSFVSACVLSCFSRVLLFATPWTVAHQAPLSMGILQARILEWVSMPSSEGSSLPRDRTHIWLHVLPCKWIFYPLSHLGSHDDHF